MKADEDSVIVDLDLFKIKITIQTDAIKWQFLPTSKLEASVKDTVEKEYNILDKNLERSLISKIREVYKEMF